MSLAICSYISLTILRVRIPTEPKDVNKGFAERECELWNWVETGSSMHLQVVYGPKVYVDKECC